MPKQIKTKPSNDPPNAKQLLRILAGKPSTLEVALGAKPTKPPVSYVALAKLMGCTVYKVKKAMAGILDHPSTDFENMDIWGPRGRPNKELNLTEESLKYIISRPTLRLQCGWTLAERAIHSNEKFQTTLN